MKPRALISSVVATCFLVVAITGLATFLLPYGERLAAVHTIAGFAFVGFAFVHAGNNARSLTAYARGRRWPSPTLVIAIGVAGLVVLGTLRRAGPLWSLAAWGESRRDALAANETPRRVYDVLRLPGASGGRAIQIEVSKGSAYLQRTRGMQITPQC